MADNNERLLTLIQINSDRFEWVKFLDEINKLGYEKGKDYFHNGTGNPSAMFVPQVANDTKVKKLRDKYKVTSFGLESVASMDVIRKSFFTEGSKVVIADKSKFNKQVATVVEAQNTTYKLKLEDGVVVTRGLHEIKESLDPVGKEDSDINNDRKVNSTDEYLKNRRSAISSNMDSSFEEQLDEFVVVFPNEEGEEEESVMALSPNVEFDAEKYSNNLSDNLAVEDRDVLVQGRRYNDAINNTEEEVIPGIDEAVNDAMEFGEEFPFNKLIDFRYFDDNMSFGPDTQEYTELDELMEEEWQEYLDMMASAGVTVEYDTAEGEYKVITSTSDGELEEGMLNESHLDSREDKTDYILDNSPSHAWQRDELDMLSDADLDKLYSQTEREVGPPTEYVTESEDYCDIEDQDTNTINNLAEASGFKVKFAKGILKEGKEIGKVKIIVEKYGVKTEISYDDNTLNKPWKIGNFEFNFMKEALASIKKPIDTTKYRKEILEGVQKSKLNESVKRFASTVDPKELSKSEAQRRAIRSQEILNKFLSDDLISRGINR